uniref:G protein-coupled receptor n=1 Tax=Panagrolaimus sp. JU765 TaxID=591449 RepID=A0AC34RF45_9BILA
MGWIPFCFLFIIAEGICGWNSYRRFSEFLSQHSQIQDDVVRSIGWFNNDTGELYSYGSFSLVTNNTVSYGILIVSYIIIIFCSLAVYVRLKLQVSALHYTDVKIYRQTSITLFMEALIPFVIVVVPILANLLAVSFKYSTAWLDSLLVTIAVLGPFFNSITKLTVIKVYRNTVLTWLHIRRPKVVNLSSINRNSQVQNSKLQDNLVNDTTHAKMCSIH